MNSKMRSLTPRVVRASGDEGEQHARAQQIVDAQQQIEAEAHSEREGDVDARVMPTRRLLAMSTSAG